LLELCTRIEAFFLSLFLSLTSSAYPLYVYWVTVAPDHT